MVLGGLDVQRLAALRNKFTLTKGQDEADLFQLTVRHEAPRLSCPVSVSQQVGRFGGWTPETGLFTINASETRCLVRAAEDLHVLILCTFMQTLSLEMMFMKH